MSQPQVVPNEPAKSKGRGCLIGCLVAAILTIVIVGAIAFFAYTSVGSMVNNFTDDAPVPLPTTTIPGEERAELENRVEDFRAVLENDGEAATLELTADEINALIGNLTEDLPLEEWIHVTIEDDVLGGEISVPLSAIPLPIPFLQGRYVNGAATFSVDVVNNRLQVFIESLEVKGVPVPQEVLSQLANENLAKDFNKMPQNRAYLQRVEDITVKDGKLIITLKGEEP